MRIFNERPIEELSDIYLLDEHRTHHAMESVPSLRQGMTLEQVKERHDRVAEEMIKRGRLVRRGYGLRRDGYGGDRKRFKMRFSPNHLTPIGLPETVDLSEVVDHGE